MLELHDFGCILKWWTANEVQSRSTLTSYIDTTVLHKATIETTFLSIKLQVQSWFRNFKTSKAELKGTQLLD
jgi:hypothetical protein